MMTWLSGVPWADQLPRMKAEREAWAAEHRPALRARQAKQQAERDEVASLIARGLTAIEATEEQRDLVFAKTGFR